MVEPELSKILAALVLTSGSVGLSIGACSSSRCESDCGGGEVRAQHHQSDGVTGTTTTTTGLTNTVTSVSGSGSGTTGTPTSEGVSTPSGSGTASS